MSDWKKYHKGKVNYCRKYGLSEELNGDEIRETMEERRRRIIASKERFYPFMEYGKKPPR